jgi:membrane fusion protein (multidrug efflux system)
MLGIAYLVYYRINENKKISAQSAGGGPGGKSGGKDGKSGPAGPGMAVEGIIVSTTKFNSDLDISGSIEANESVVLRSEVAGLVTGIFFKEGSTVNKGTVLVKINDKDIQAQLREAQTKLNLAASNENRAKQLLEKGAISQEEYDTSLANLQTVKSQIQLIHAQLAKTNVIAPFSGKIGLRNISTGEYLTPNTTIANLMSVNPIKITFSIPEKYVSQVKMNAEISFTTDANSKVHKAKIFAIEPGINQQTRTLQIKALSPNGNNELLPGSFAQIKLALSTIDDAILIPTESIIPVLSGKVVYISKNGMAEQVNVDAGTRTADKVLINGGLNVGDTVLTTGAMSLKPGANISVKIVNKK